MKREREEEAAGVERRGDVVLVTGALTIGNAAATLSDAAHIFDERRDRLVFDLSGLQKCDSAALAVLLEWSRQAGRRNRALTYRNAPERLRQLARIAELEAVLHIDA